ncbi:PEP-CTERM sorting domain-containing protein [Planctomycetales bacterium ZRK34]|nr:PEP-CTERM sorting domain-containing protein [Planctomycetales bacterium ZRK34]
MALLLGMINAAAKTEAGVVFSQDGNDLVVTISSAITLTATQTASNSVYSVIFQNVYSTDITSAVFDLVDTGTSTLTIESTTSNAYSSWGYRTALGDITARDFIGAYRNSSFPAVAIGDTITINPGVITFVNHFSNGNARLPDVESSTVIVIDASNSTAITSPTSVVAIPEPATALGLTGAFVVMSSKRRRLA